MVKVAIIVFIVYESIDLLIEDRRKKKVSILRGAGLGLFAALASFVTISYGTAFGEQNPWIALVLASVIGLIVGLVIH